MSGKLPPFHSLPPDGSAVRGPECPEPEVLLDWVEQGERHPQAAHLLDHLFECASCRREYTDLREIRALRPLAGPQPSGVARALPGKVRAWARELLASGATTPVRWVGRSLETLHALMAPPLAAAVRGPEAPAGGPFTLSPSHTAVRSGHVVFRWSGGPAAREYEVVVARQVGTHRWPVWRGVAATPGELSLPPEAALESGGVYLWQVIARNGYQETPSPLAGFVVLTEALRRRVDALEQDTGDAAPPARIGLYEAHGLHEEALREAEAWLRQHPDDAQARTIRDGILQRRAE